MPLQHDLEEGKESLALLTEMLTSNTQVVLGENGERMAQMLKILGQTFGKNWMRNDTLQKLKQFFSQTKTDESFVQLIQSNMNGLSEEETRRLSKMIE